MTLREKIIVGLMVLSIVYGGYELLVLGNRKGGDAGSPDGKPAPTAEPLPAESGDVKGLSDSMQTLLQWAQTPWEEGLFVKREPLPQAPPPPEPTAVGLRYSGFVQMGKRKLAIINGMEYEKGDQLVSGDFVIKRILPNQVVLWGITHKREFILEMAQKDGSF